jgi:hypothetical protein
MRAEYSAKTSWNAPDQMGQIKRARSNGESRGQLGPSSAQCGGNLDALKLITSAPNARLSLQATQFAGDSVCRRENFRQIARRLESPASANCRRIL